MANDSLTSTPRIIALAERLLDDIQHRQLAPGDRYMTTEAASKMLGVGSGLANRALQLLERRQVIVRRQRRGAFIAETRERSSALLRRVHFLVHRNYLKSEGVGNDFVLLGMQEALPGVQVQISFLPQDGADLFVGRLIDQSFAAKTRDGFVLVRAPYEVQRVVADRGVPAVVYGGRYAGIDQLPRFDRDMSAIGRIAMTYLLERGHRRIGLLSRQHSLPGDHETRDAIHAAGDAAGLSAGAMIERFFPPAHDAYRAEVRRLLGAEKPPTAFICRSLEMARAAAAVSQGRKVRMGRQVDLFVCDYYLLDNDQPAFANPRPQCSSEAQGRRIASLLLAQSLGDAVADEIVPVALELPGASSKRPARSVRRPAGGAA